uniref:Uncharacterized protein n=1 Tax=Rhizophora mucronata TaxID=61149 RepID=A0A2P2NCS0_RHIMU
MKKKLMNTLFAKDRLLLPTNPSRTVLLLCLTFSRLLMSPIS